MKKFLFYSLIFLSLNAREVSYFANEHIKTFVKKDSEEVKAQKLSDLQKRETTSNLFFNNSYSTLNSKSISTIIGDNLPSDLNMFDDIENNFFSKVNRTVTTFGELYLILELLNPTTNSNNILHKQEFLKKLLENEKEFNELVEELNKIKDCEEDFLLLFEQDDSKIKNLFYTKNVISRANNNAYLMSALNNIVFAGKWTNANVFDLLEAIQTNKYQIKNNSATEFTKKTANILGSFIAKSLNPLNLFNKTKTVYKNIRDRKKVEKDFINRFTEEMPYYNEKEIQAIKTSAKVTSHLNYIMPTILLGFDGFLKGKLYKEIYDRQRVINNIQSKLVKIATLFKSLNKIVEILNSIDINLDYESNTDVLGILNDLNKSTFNEKSLIYFEGRVLSTYFKLKNNKSKFANLIVNIAKVDSLVAMAKLVNENNLCFVSFIDSTKPEIYSTKIWNLFISQEKAVKNDVYADKNIVLSGVNAGGKSTIIKAFLQNILLGQTFGVAAAESFNFTPFTKISSYLNIVDDISSGDSLFKAEVKRAKKLIEQTNLLSENEFGFCAIDELFTGTAADAGEECAKELILKLTNKPNSQFIFATHYKTLTELEQNLPNKIENFMMEAPEITNGKIKYPFTITKGVNTTNIAKEIITEEFLA